MVVKLSLQRAKALCVKGIIMPAKDQSLANKQLESCMTANKQSFV